VRGETERRERERKKAKNEENHQEWVELLVKFN
jgi:hypothetical protein